MTIPETSKHEGESLVQSRTSKEGFKRHGLAWQLRHVVFVRPRGFPNRPNDETHWPHGRRPHKHVACGIATCAQIGAFVRTLCRRARLHAASRGGRVSKARVCASAQIRMRASIMHHCSRKWAEGACRGQARLPREPRLERERARHAQTQEATCESLGGAVCAHI